MSDPPVQMDVSLKGDDEVISGLSLKALQISIAETKRNLSRCDSRLSAMVTSGSTTGQEFRDLTQRSKKLREALLELEDTEAQMRLRAKESS